MSRENSTALDLVRCCVAARHLDAQTRSRVAPRLQALVEKTILQPGYLSPSFEFVEALLILSLWEPLHGDGYNIPRDSRLLAMSAIEAAMSIGIDRYDIMNLRRLSLEHLDPMSEEVRGTRMWATASNIEQLLLFGSGKVPRSKRPRPDNLEEFVTVYNTDDSRDVRLVLTRRLIDITHRGMSITMDNPADLGQWYKETTEVLASMGWIHRLIAPLPVISPFDAFYFNMVEVHYNLSRLLVLHHTLVTMRQVFDQSSQRMWFQVQHNNIYVAHGWTGDALYSAEAALIAILSRPDITSLSTAPDQYFLLITFACTFLIVARFAIYHIREGPVHGQTENLLNRIAERFQQASLSPDHLPSKCAEAIKELVGAWDRRGPRMITRYKEEAIPSSIQHQSHFLSRNLAKLRSHSPRLH
ncbi:hypothetical protein ONZ45_g10172 [Pleurotus djamor]|nr:hypothetical protein ONZ45_g10172 [Pleurotus djamor]